jgi:hypothetical protein
LRLGGVFCPRRFATHGLILSRLGFKLGSTVNYGVA